MDSDQFRSSGLAHSQSISNPQPILPRQRKFVTYAVVWAVAIIITLFLDGRVARTVHSSGTYELIKSSLFCRCIKAFGTFSITLLIIPLAAWRSRFKAWQAAALILASALISGMLYSVLKWVFGRSRPIGNRLFNPNAFQMHFFDGGWRALFVSSPDLSFPSGHASLAFATATALSICVPRLAAASYAVAIMVAVERVLEGAHYPSDVIAGAGCGVLAALIAMRLCQALLNSDKFDSGDIALNRSRRQEHIN